MRKGFFDNDIVIKLAGCGLMDVARQQLGIEENWVIPSLKSRLSNPKRRDRLAQNFDNWPESSRIEIVRFVEQTQKLLPPKNQAFIDRYQSEYLLDIGELQLLEAAFYGDDTFLITGDKRFLERLTNIPDLLSQALDKLPRRFICFESTLLLLVDSLGYEAVRDQVLPFKEYDTQIKIVFGGGATKTEEQAREALLYELNRLGGKMARLLHYPLIT